ncbi:MAG TPA: hypothetical protein VJN18_28335 [Polyangiaceae bacterium]|nr:hypothetical protein [Polyangiaceae bacterium]
MKSQKAKLGMLLLIAVGGCSQIIGLSDYEVDPALGDAGQGGQAQGEGGDASGSSGKAGGGDAGVGNVGQGGESVQGGMPAVGGTSAGGEGGSPEVPVVGGTSAGGEGGSPEVPVVVIPCDSVDCCTTAGGIVDERQLLENVDFEAGRSWWGESSSGSFAIIVNETQAGTINAHLGAWFVWLGGATNEVGVILSPTLDIPADTGWVTLSGYRYLRFDSTTSFTDYAQIRLFEEGMYDVPYEDIYIWDNFAFNTNSWTPFEVSGSGEFYASLPLQLAITGVTDATSDDPTVQEASNFFFDDISFTSSRCVEPPQ